MDTLEVGHKRSEGTLYHFDKVYNSSLSQATIFEDVKPFV